MTKNNLELLSLELGKDDEMLTIEFNTDEISLRKTDGKGNYKVVDGIGVVIEGEGENIRVRKGNKIVGYLDIKDHTYFDGETLDGSLYSIKGRNLETRNRVEKFFIDRGWKINSK
jgi:hypothetical protein